MSDDAPAKIPNAGKKAKDLNEVIRYTLWSSSAEGRAAEDRAVTPTRSRSSSTSSPRRT